MDLKELKEILQILEEKEITEFELGQIDNRIQQFSEQLTQIISDFSKGGSDPVAAGLGIKWFKYLPPVGMLCPRLGQSSCARQETKGPAA